MRFAMEFDRLGMGFGGDASRFTGNWWSFETEGVRLTGGNLEQLKVVISTFSSGGGGDFMRSFRFLTFKLEVDRDFSLGFTLFVLV